MCSILQLQELFTLTDDDILGYQPPKVITELHVSVAKSCVEYRFG